MLRWSALGSRRSLFRAITTNEGGPPASSEGKASMIEPRRAGLDPEQRRKSVGKGSR